jgi:hypothetical protein
VAKCYAGRDVELAKNVEEIRGLKLSHIAKDKAAAKVREKDSTVCLNLYDTSSRLSCAEHVCKRDTSGRLYVSSHLTTESSKRPVT